MNAQTKMPLPSRRRALELGAGFIENDLHEMRRTAGANYERAEQAEPNTPPGYVQPAPVTHSHEHDIMKAAEWAYAAATLRALADREGADRG